MDVDVSNTIMPQHSSIHEVNYDKFVYFLNGIELYNFKSYQGEHIIGPLSQFTGIIGPNGSGKSNLMDAISFALVIKSDTLRVKKISDLITVSQKGSDDALIYVKLLFKSKTSNVQCSIKRSVERYRSTKYYFNDVNVSKNEYLAHLEDLGFNVKNQIFLLFQDTVNNLITKNPKDFTSILEDISGSAHFKNSYNNLKESCDKKEDELHKLTGKKRSILESKKFIDFLTKQTEHNVHLFKEIEEGKIKLGLIDMYKIEKEMFNLEPMIEKLTIDIDQKINEINEQKVQKEDLFNIVSQLQQKISDSAKKLRDLEIGFICQSNLEYQNSCSSMERLRKEMKNASRNIENLCSQLEKSELNLTELKRLIELTNGEIERLEMDRSNAARGIQLNDQDLLEYNNLKIAWETNNDAAELRNKTLEITKVIETIESEIKIEEVKQSNLQNELNTIEERAKKKMDDKIGIELNQNIQKKVQLEKLLTEVEDKIQKSDDETNRIRFELSQMKSDLKTKYHKTKVKNVIEREKSLLEFLKRSFKGVRGRLKDLCEPIDKKYKIAFNRIIQKYANAIVVDTRKTINLILKNERSKFVGQIFLALDTIKAPNIKENLRHLKIGSSTCLIYDLIKCKDPMIESIVRFVVGNTVYCETQGQALIVAYKLETRNNSITKNGILYQANGKISYNNSINNNNNNFDYQEIPRIEEEINQLTGKYLEQCKQLELKKEEKRQIELQIICLETKIKHAEKYLKDLEEMINKDSIRKSELKIEVNGIETTLIEKQSHLQRKRSELKMIESDLSELEQGFFNNFLQQLEFSSLKQFEMMYFNNVEEVINKLNEAKRRQMELKNKEKIELDKKYNDKLTKWKEKYDELKQKFENVQAKLKENKNKLDQDEKIRTNLKEELEYYKTELKEHEMVLKNCEAMLDKSIKTHESLVRSKVDSKHLISQLQEARHRLYKRLYLEGITLPFLHHSSHFNEAFSHQEERSYAEMLELEDNLKIDYEIYDISTIIETADDFDKLRMEIECEIRTKEEEVQKLTLTDSSVRTKKGDITREFKAINKKIDKAKTELMDLKNKFFEVKKQRYQAFQLFLDKVSRNLQSFYRIIMRNSTSQSFLIAENPDEPYLGGVVFNCIVPGKIFQPISCLSGGEKTLAAFAFIFSVYSESFPIFFVLDEIDGPLDTVNISKLFHFIESQISNVQFIFISHRPESFSMAHSLIGVYKTATNSQTLSLNLHN